MGDCSRAGKPSGYVTSHLARLSLQHYTGWQNEYQLLGWVVINGDGGCSFLAVNRRANGSSVSAWSKGRQSSGTTLQSAFIVWTRWTLAETLSHDDSTINIVLVISIIIIIKVNLYHQASGMPVCSAQTSLLSCFVSYIAYNHYNFLSSDSGFSCIICHWSHFS